MTTYEQFLGKCLELNGEKTYYDSNVVKYGVLKKEYRTRYGEDSYGTSRKICWEPEDRYEDIVEYLYVEWETCGVRGGSCWDDSNPQPYYANETPKELTILDSILEYYCGDISYIKYKNLYKELVEEDSRTVHEYYGNETTYGYKRINIKNLYEYLCKKDLILADKSV